MNTEKVKELKDYIQKSADLGQYYMLAGGKITMMEVVDYINELEKEKKNYYDRLNNLQTYIDNHEDIWKGNTKNTLKQFAERLKEDFTKKKNKLIKEREIAIKYDDFILIDALAYKIDELQYAIDNIDETLKEFTN